MPLRDAIPVADRRGAWETSGQHPQFVLENGDGDLPRGWVVLSFDLAVEGTVSTLSVLSIETGLVTQRMVLANSGRLCAVAHLPSDLRSVRLELSVGAGIVSIGPVSVRPCHKAEAAVRMLATFLTTQVGSWRQAAAATRTVLRLLRSGGPAAVVRRVVERLFYARNADSRAPLVPPVEHLNDVQRYERWILETEPSLAGGPPPALASDLVAVLIRAPEGAGPALSQTLASLRGQTQRAWRAVVALPSQGAGQSMGRRPPMTVGFLWPRRTPPGRSWSERPRPPSSPCSMPETPWRLGPLPKFSGSFRIIRMSTSSIRTKM